jgi:histone H3/H4
MLSATDIQLETGFPSSDGGGAVGELGADIYTSDRISEAGIDGIVGGGLRDDSLASGRKEHKISRHGIHVPNLPSGVVKKLAARFARTRTGGKARINKETLTAIEQASAWFFEQASEDLTTYSKHAGRKTIDESDVITLLRR